MTYGISQTLNSMVIRALTPYYLLGQDSVRLSIHPIHEHPSFLYLLHALYAPQGFPATNYNVNILDLDGSGNEHVNARSDAHTELIKDIANAAAILLKNTNNALPLSLSGSKKTAVVGLDSAANSGCSLNACDDGTLSVGCVRAILLFRF